MKPTQLDTLFRQAVAAFESRQLSTAEMLCTQVLAKKKRHVQATALLGYIAFARARFEEAETHLKRAAALMPRDPAIQHKLAQVADVQGRYDDAVKRFDRVLRARPADDRAVAGKARALIQSGRGDEALKVLEPFVQDPIASAQVAMAYALELVGRKRYREAIEVCSAQLEKPDLDPQIRRHLWAQLGRAAEREGDVDRAFDAYARGNAAVTVSYEPRETTELADRMIAVCSREGLAAMPRAATTSELPVLVVGMPRSGTTLVDRIIDAHPRGIGLVEPGLLNERARHMSLVIGSTLPFPECMADLDEEDVARLSAELIDDFTRRAGHATRAAEKSTDNFWKLGLASVLAPRARVIHVRRDPLDIGLSCFAEPLFELTHPHTTDLRHIGLFYRQYERLMAHWKDVLDMPFLEIEYETLTAEPEPTIRRIIDFCGLEWDDACLAFHSTGRTAQTLSYDQVKKPMYRTSVGRAQRFIKHLGPLVEALNEE